MAAILTQGLTAFRDGLKNVVTHVGVSTDQTAFSASQTDLSPNAGATDRIEAASKVDVDSATFDAQITITGDTEFTNQTIWTVGVLNGATSSAAISRTVRTQGIGVQAGDVFTIGVRCKVEDNTP